MPLCVYEPSGLEAPAVAHQVQLVASAAVTTLAANKRRTSSSASSRGVFLQYSSKAWHGASSRAYGTLAAVPKMPQSAAPLGGSLARTANEKTLSAPTFASRQPDRPLPARPQFLKRTPQDRQVEVQPQPAPNFLEPKRQATSYGGSAFSVAVLQCRDAGELLDLVHPYLLMPDAADKRRVSPYGILYGGDLANALRCGIKVGLSPHHLYSLVDASMATMQLHHRYHAFPTSDYYALLIPSLLDSESYSLSLRAFERMLHFRVRPSPKLFNALLARATQMPDAVIPGGEFDLAPYVAALKANLRAPRAATEAHHDDWMRLLTSSGDHEATPVFSLLALMEESGVPAGWLAVHRVMRLLMVREQYALGTAFFDAWRALDRPATPGVYEAAIRLGAHAPDRGMAYAVQLARDLTTRGMRHDVYVSNALLYCTKVTGGRVDDAQKILSIMRSNGIEPDDVSYVLFLVMCASQGDRQHLDRELPMAIRSRPLSPALYSALIMNCTSMTEVVSSVRALSAASAEPSVFAYCSLMRACSRSGSYAMRRDLLSRATESFGQHFALARVLLQRTMVNLCAHSRHVDEGVRAYAEYREALASIRGSRAVVAASLKGLATPSGSVPKKFIEMARTTPGRVEPAVVRDMMLLTSSALHTAWPTFVHYKSLWGECGERAPDSHAMRLAFASLRRAALHDDDAEPAESDAWMDAAQSLFVSRELRGRATSPWEVVQHVNAQLPGGPIMNSVQLRQFHPLASMALLVLAEGVVYRPECLGAHISSAKEVCASLQEVAAYRHISSYFEQNDMLEHAI